MTREELKEKVLKNLNNAGLSYYTTNDLNDAIQDGYDDIVALSQCLVGSIQLNWQGDLTYYFFKSLGATDYLRPVAIFNHTTKLFLGDNLSLRDFDKLRDDWETWNAEPQYWAPHSFESVAIVPKPLVASGQYTLYYIKEAPVIASDVTAFLFSKFADDLIEAYVTADLLEQAEEFTKATNYWKDYFDGLRDYKIQCSNLAKADLLLHL